MTSQGAWTSSTDLSTQKKNSLNARSFQALGIQLETWQKRHYRGEVWGGGDKHVKKTNKKTFGDGKC